MGSSFLITLREGLEASLVISILLTYLAKTNRRDENKSVWVGTIVAIGACLILGIAFYVLVDGLNGNVEYAVEGTLALAATIVLTQISRCQLRRPNQLLHRLPLTILLQFQFSR